MTAPRVGALLELEVGAVAHGGHCVARHDGQVVFVRHALPGERVRARVTSSERRFLRADAIEVLSASADRVAPPCPYAGPGGCGGCDWQHAGLDAQRRLKTAVLHEALRRQGGVEQVGGRPLEEIQVVGVDGDVDGLRWRTRVDYAVAAGPGSAQDPGESVGRDTGEVGFFAHRSSRLVAVDDCRIATEAVVATEVTRRAWPEVGGLRVVASSGGDRVVLPARPGGAALRRVAAALPTGVAVAGAGGRSWVREEAAGRSWRVAADGFWQVHPGAPELLVSVVRGLLAPRPGEHLLDLYCGVGLFAGALAADLGPSGRVDALEANPRAVADARRNLHDLPQVRLHEADVLEWLRRGAAASTSSGVDLVVLDPTRSGAGAQVVHEVLALHPRAVAYVACDPVALARDLRTARECGYEPSTLQSYDIFPMTHHFETVALLTPTPTPA